MQSRKFLLLSAAGVAISALLVATHVSAHFPAGVPVTPPGPFVCTTTNFKVEAILGPSGEFPVDAPCLSHPGQTCADYGYKISSLSTTGPNVDHTVFANSADQDLDRTAPTSFVSVPGAGDNTTNFLKDADHEYAVRFNSSNTKSVEAHMFIVGPSTPRISSVLIRSGTKITESCLIAGVGVVGIRQPIALAECLRLDQNTSMLVNRGANYCAKGAVLFFLNTTCSGNPARTDFGVQIPGLVYSGDPRGARCGEVLRQLHNSPERFTYESGGVLYEFCYDNETGAQLDCGSF